CSGNAVGCRLPGHREGTMRRAYLGPVLVAILLGATSVHATCGDQILDPGEQCDAGAANGYDGCCSAACQLVDEAYDGTCDALGPCPDGQGTPLKESKLTVNRVLTASGRDSLRLTGTLTVPSTPAIDPSASGARLRMSVVPDHGPASTLLDVTLPGGSGWKQ